MNKTSSTRVRAHFNDELRIIDTDGSQPEILTFDYDFVTQAVVLSKLRTFLESGAMLRVFSDKDLDRNLVGL
jgi:hypothetical protein